MRAAPHHARSRVAWPVRSVYLDWLQIGGYAWADYGQEVITERAAHFGA